MGLIMFPYSVRVLGSDSLPTLFASLIPILHTRTTLYLEWKILCLRVNLMERTLGPLLQVSSKLFHSLFAAEISVSSPHSYHRITALQLSLVVPTDSSIA